MGRSMIMLNMRIPLSQNEQLAITSRDNLTQYTTALGRMSTREIRIFFAFCDDMKIEVPKKW